MIPLFDLRGPEFLRFYMVAAPVACVATGVLAAVFSRVRGNRRPDPVAARPTVYEIAYAAGGPRRAVAAALEKFHRDDAFAADGDIAHFRQGYAEATTDWFERAVAFTLRRERSRAAAGAVLSEAASALEPGAIKAGLLESPRERRYHAMLAFAPVATVLVIGAIKVGVGILRDKPVSILVMLVIFTTVLGLLLLALGTSPRFDRRRIPESLRGARDDDSEADRAALRVALGGLAGSVAAVYFIALYPGVRFAAGADSGGSGCAGGAGCGGGGGGGGGCGGGCGGCGGGH